MTDTTSEVAEVGKDSTANVPTSSTQPVEEAEHPSVIGKEKNANQGVASNAMKPLSVTQDLIAEKETPIKMEIVLATVPLLAKNDPTNKCPEAPGTASTQPNNAPSKEKLVIKKKQILVQFFLLCFFVLLFFL